VAQTDPAEAKTAILSFAKDNIDVGKDLVRAAVKFDPMASKMFSDNPISPSRGFRKVNPVRRPFFKRSFAPQAGFQPALFIHNAP